MKRLRGYAMIKMLKLKAKSMKNKKLKTSLFSRLKVAIFAIVAVALVVGASVPSIRSTFAATCNSISECQAQINANNNAVASLQSQATSYQDAINHLNSQISLLQGSINTNVAQQTSLQQQITEGQRQIDHQRAVLGSDVKAMYVDGTPSTIEMLATSKDLSEFVDKQEYRTAVQNKLHDTLQEIAALQKKLQAQKVEIDGLLAQLRSQQAQLNAAYAEQANLLAYNQSQQASYNQQTAANRQRLDQLIAAQRRANGTDGGYYFLRFPGAFHSFNGGNYPYANAGFGMSTAPGCVDGDGPDAWGYCTRQCVSYAAWAVEASGRSAPMYYGNARDWVAAAYAHGIPVYRTPQPGDIAISTAGTWGHAMYVEAVSGGQIYVSQYNQQLTGQYSTQWRSW